MSFFELFFHTNINMSLLKNYFTFYVMETNKNSKNDLKNSVFELENSKRIILFTFELFYSIFWHEKMRGEIFLSLIDMLNVIATPFFVTNWNFYFILPPLLGWDSMGGGEKNASFSATSPKRGGKN